MMGAGDLGQCSCAEASDSFDGNLFRMTGRVLDCLSTNEGQRLAQSAHVSAAARPVVRRMLIADDHAVVRHGPRALLKARAGWAIVGEAPPRRRAASGCIAGAAGRNSLKAWLTPGRLAAAVNYWALA